MSKRLNVSVEEELHRQLKIAVAAAGTTIGQFVAEAIEEKINKGQIQISNENSSLAKEDNK